MFCLFRNSKISYPLNIIVFIISVAPVVYWLNFALIEKSFLHNFMAGRSLFVDLLLGLPVVLIFAVIIYAMIFWVLKLLIVILLPAWVEPLSSLNDEIDDTLDSALGEDYWMVEPEESPEIEQQKSMQQTTDIHSDEDSSHEVSSKEKEPSDASVIDQSSKQ